MKPDLPLAVSVRFCGGCNPYFDAGEALEQVERLIGMPIPVWRPEHLPEICLLIKQCSSDCFSDFRAYARQETVFLERLADAPRAAARILTLMCQK